MNDDDLSRLFRELPSPMKPRHGRAAAIVASTRRRRWQAASASVVAVVAVIIGTLAIVDGGGSAPVSPGVLMPTAAARTHSAGPVPTLALAPTAVTVSCYDAGHPIPLTQVKPGVYGSAIAAPLRAFLAEPGRFAGLQLGELPRGQWALLSHDATHRVFAQRTATGVGAVLYFKLYLGSWQPDVQCSIRYGTDTVQHVRQVAVHGLTLDLNWDNGTCYPQARRPIDQLVRRVVVTETPTHVFISLLTYPNPAEAAAEASQAAALPSGTVLGCAGVGLQDHVDVNLKAPLGNRTLLDVSTVPPEPIELNGTVGKPLR